MVKKNVVLFGVSFLSILPILSTISCGESRESYLNKKLGNLFNEKDVLSFSINPSITDINDLFSSDDLLVVNEDKLTSFNDTLDENEKKLFKAEYLIKNIEIPSKLTEIENLKITVEFKGGKFGLNDDKKIRVFDLSTSNLKVKNFDVKNLEKPTSAWKWGNKFVEQFSSIKESISKKIEEDKITKEQLNGDNGHKKLGYKLTKDDVFVFQDNVYSFLEKKDAYNSDYVNLYIYFGSKEYDNLNSIKNECAWYELKDVKLYTQSTKGSN